MARTLATKLKILAIAALPLLCALVLIPGCASNKGTGPFMKAINSIEPGTSMERVRDGLGAPDVKREGVGPVRPVPPVGSPEAVLVTVPAGVKYRQWIYKRGDSHYHVFFTPTVGKTGKWEVLAVRSVAASRIY